MRVKGRIQIVVWSLSACLGFGFALLPFATQNPQQPGAPPPGTIRVRVQLVPVDIVVTDKHNKPVTDLQKQDFTILEDGRPQDIRHFSTRKLEPETPDPAIPPLRKVPALELAPQSSRTFLILLGRGRHQRFFQGIDGLIDFVRAGLLPQDRVAVFAYNRATDFTTDHKRIALILEQYKKIHDRIETWAELRFSGLAAIYGSREIPKEWQPEIDRIFAVEGGPGIRQVPPGRISVEGEVIRDSAQTAATITREETRRDLRQNASPRSPSGLVGAESAEKSLVFDRLEAGFITDLPFEEYAEASASAHQDLQNLFTSIEYMRYMEGEKHILFFSGSGLFLPRLEYDRSIASLASDARIAIDTFQTQGIREAPIRLQESGGAYWTPAMATSPGRAQLGLSSSRYSALSTLRGLSELTGGTSAIHTYVSEALARVNETTRFEYLLGYYPTNNTWDGKFRRLTVKVNRPGLNVQYRRGYFARDILQPFDREEFLAYSRIASAAASLSTIADIGFEVDSAWEKNQSGKRQTLIKLKIDASTVRFEPVNNRQSARLRIAVFCTDEDDDYITDVWESLDMDLRQETWQKVLREGIPYSVMVPVTPGRRNFKVVLYDIKSDKVGSRVRRVG